MTRGLNWRFILIVAITIICVYCIFPTARYFKKVSSEEVPPDVYSELRENYTQYFSNAAPEDPIEKKQFDKNLDECVDAYAKKQEKKLDELYAKLTVKPESKENFKKQIAFLEKQKEFESMRDKSLKLGLDLMGGVDVLLAVDMEKTQQQRLNDIAYNLKKRFTTENVDASVEVIKEKNAIKLSIQNKKDLKNAKNLLNEENYKQTFMDFDADQLEEAPIELTLRQEVSERYANEAITGAIKVIRNRVDELKVTQPSVAKQGRNRVRVQLPGERDPERVISNIIKPASLEFRLLDDNSDEKVRTKYEADGTLKPGADPDPGYVYRKGVISKQDETGKVIEQKVGYLVKDKVEMTGANLKNAWVIVNNAELESPVQVHLEFDPKGATLFRDVTAKSHGKRLAIILDNIVYSAPEISETIPQGRCFIRGSFSVGEAQDLSLVLKAGALPAELEVVEKRAIGASLGTESIRDSVKALILGSAIVIIFMIVYYGTAGFVANIALLINILIILAFLALARATLTLSGIGGILLTIGMAVDANVLIYERIREELDSGKPVKAALNLGFKRAFSVIFDSNLTTLITAFVLLQFAEGSVQGFALTMAIGLIANLYTGLTVTHTIAEMIYNATGKFGVGKVRVLKNTKVDFMKLRFPALIFSLVLIIAGIGSFIARRHEIMALDFQGGVISTVKFEKKIPADELRKIFDKEGIKSARIQDVPNKNDYIIKMKLVENDIQKTQEAVQNVLSKNFKASEFEMIGASAVGNEVGQEFIGLAIQTVIIACICMLIYLSFRFQFIFGLGAVVALIHDTLICIGAVALTGREISLDVVSAILIVIGYSVNDTIVIFDRIRENLRSVFGVSFGNIANKSINESLSRTIITALTVLFTVVVLYFFSSGSLNDFAFVLIVGVVIGTYSSNFIATPIVYEWNKRQAIKIEKEQQYKKKGYSAAAQKI